MIREYSNPNHKQWTKAIIHNVLGPRNYLCKLPDNKIVKRHLNQIIKCNVVPKEIPIVRTVNEDISQNINVQNCTNHVLDDLSANIIQPGPCANIIEVENAEIVPCTANNGCNTPVARPKRKIVPPNRLNL